MKIAGVSFADEQGLADKVRAQLAGGAVWADPADYEAQDGMVRALRGAGKHKQQLAEFVAAHLTDDDLVVRTGAVAVVGEVAAILGADAIAIIAEANESLFYEVTPKGHKIDQPDLWWQLLIALGRSIGKKDQRALELYRANAGASLGFWLMGPLAKHDTNWLVEHAGAVVPANMLPGLLHDIADAKQRAELVRRVPWSAKTGAAALSGPWSALPYDATEVATLRQLIADASGVSA